MKRFAISSKLSAIAFALAIGAAGSVHAATTTGNMTLTGTMTDAPAPATCTIVSIPNVDASHQIPVGDTASYVKSTTMTVNCSSGLGYTLRAAQDLNPLMVGPTGAHARLRVGATNIGTTPHAMTGTGANQSIPIDLTFTNQGGSFLRGLDGGAISGTIVMTLTY